MEELIKKVQEWANERGLNKPEQALNQFLKVNSEFGETCEAILHRPKNGDDDLIDGFGDIIVTFIVLCHMRNLQATNIQYTPQIIDGSNQLYFGTFNKHLSKVCELLIRGSDIELEYAIDDAISALFAFISDAGFTPKQCLQAAYNEIKDRKGVTVNGTFIKDEPKETAQVVDLSTLEIGDSVEYRHGDIDKVISCYIEDDGKYKVVTETDIDVYNKNGNWLESKLSKFDIVRIIKA